jgi:hypothetical protein
MDGKTRSRSLFVTVFALVLAIGAIGIGVASGQTSGNTYTGCLKNGTLTRVNIGIAPTSPCVGGASQVSWNETGQQGPPGSSVCSTGSPMSLSGGTNDTVVPGGSVSSASLIQQVAASATDIPSAEVQCFGTLSNFSVTASGNPDGTPGNDVYRLFVLNDGITDMQCSISAGPGPYTCTDDSSIEVLPGDLVSVMIRVVDGNPTPVAFDWTATFTYSMPTAPISPI